MYGMCGACISIKSAFRIEGVVGVSPFLPENVFVDSLWRYSLSDFTFLNG